MSETGNEATRTEPANPPELEALQRHVLRLEEALAEYIERYGLTEKARAAFRLRKR